MSWLRAPGTNTEQHANNRIEADHGQLKPRLWPMDPARHRFAQRNCALRPLIGVVGRHPLVRHERDANRDLFPSEEKGLAHQRDVNVHVIDLGIHSGGACRLLAHP